MDNQTEQTAGADIAAEQAADLRALEQAAAASEVSQAQAGAPAPEEPQRPELSVELAGLLLMVAGLLKPALPTVAEIYSKETCETVGQHVAAVCDKHGWLQEGVGGKWGEEIMCLAVVGPIAYATVEAARGDIAARKAASKNRQQGAALGAAGVETTAAIPAQPVGQKTVVIGAPVTETA